MLFQIIAFFLLAAFYGCYFAKMLSQRKQNIRTDVMGKGKTGSAKRTEIALKICTYLTGFMEVTSAIANRTGSPVWLRAVGAVIAACGVAFFIASVCEMRDSWRAGVPETCETELVTSGVYRISRNPAFLGFDLTYLGLLGIFLNVPLLVLTPLTICLLHLQIVRVEEPFMREAFGDAYARYSRSVRRYLGRKA